MVSDDRGRAGLEELLGETLVGGLRAGVAFDAPVQGDDHDVVGLGRDADVGQHPVAVVAVGHAGAVRGGREAAGHHQVGPEHGDGDRSLRWADGEDRGRERVGRRGAGADGGDALGLEQLDGVEQRVGSEVTGVVVRQRRDVDACVADDLRRHRWGAERELLARYGHAAVRDGHLDVHQREVGTPEQRYEPGERVDTGRRRAVHQHVATCEQVPLDGRRLGGGRGFRRRGGGGRRGRCDRGGRGGRRHRGDRRDGRRDRSDGGDTTGTRAQEQRPGQDRGATAAVRHRATPRCG